MKMKLLCMVALAVAAITGCVTVESVKTQLNSGDAKLQAQAKDTIRDAVLYGNMLNGLGRVPVLPAEREAFANVISDSNFASELAKGMIGNGSGSDGQSTICLDEYSGLFKVLLSKVDFSNSSECWSLLIEMQRPRWGEALNRGDLAYSTKNLVVAKWFVDVVVEHLDDKSFLLTQYSDAYSNHLSKFTEEKLWQRISKLGLSADEICAIKDSRVKSKACLSITNENELKKLLEKMTEDKNLSWEEAGIVAELIGRLSTSKDKAAFIARIGHLCFDGKDEFIGKLLDQLDQNGIVVVAVKASDEVVRGCALRRIRDVNVIAKMFAKDLPKEFGDKITLVRNVGSGAATRELYESTKDEIVRKEIMIKLPDDVRVQIRQEGKAACEKLIQESQAKASETFALKGFYLGMDIGDADRLLGYYFNDWSTREGVDDGVRVLWVPQQTSPLCRAGKDGKVYELNFGKRILKLWFKYDVQDYREWAAQYSRENNVNLAYKFSQHETTVYEPDMSRSYEVVGYQDTFQHKNNTKEYRVTYFGEKKDFTFHGGIGGALIKEQAAQQLRFILGDPGLLRVKVDRD